VIEANTYWDLRPDIDQQAYSQFAKKVAGTVLKAPGIVEFRGHRNFLGSPRVRQTTQWQTLADWAKFAESAENQEIQSELHKFATNIKTELWGPSPVVPEPLRPGK
jgi:heme-degrading monooxygenase HmoA